MTATPISRPHPAAVAARNLLAEVTAACDRAKTQVLSSDERRILTARTGLGCGNPVGLVHILVSDELAKSVLSTTKVPLGSFGRSLSPRPPQHPEPLLAVSDHCPVVTEIDL